MGAGGRTKAFTGLPIAMEAMGGKPRSTKRRSDEAWIGSGQDPRRIFMAQNHGVVFFDESREVFPSRTVRI